MILDKEQRMEEAKSWSNFWTGLAVTAVGVSVLTIVFDLGGMGWQDFATMSLGDYVNITLRLLIGGVLGRILQRQAILTLRKAARP